MAASLLEQTLPERWRQVGFDLEAAAQQPECLRMGIAPRAAIGVIALHFPAKDIGHFRNHRVFIGFVFFYGGHHFLPSAGAGDKRLSWLQGSEFI